MRSKFLVAVLAVVVALSLAAGCGGGGQGGGGQGDGAQSERTGGQDRGGKTGGDKPEKESLRGVVGAVNLEESTFVVEPEGEEPVTLVFDPENVKIKLDREEAQPEDIQTGLRAKVRYSTENDENMASNVNLQSGREETTG